MEAQLEVSIGLTQFMPNLNMSIPIDRDQNRRKPTKTGLDSSFLASVFRLFTKTQTILEIWQFSVLIENNLYLYVTESLNSCYLLFEPIDYFSTNID